MASPSQSFQIRKAYAHNSSRVSMHSTQALYESIIKNGHRVLAGDIWVENIPFCQREIDSDNAAISYPNLIKKHTEIALEQVPGTNNQLYRVVNEGKWLNKWIAPVDVVNAMGETSQGFACKLYQNNGTLIGLTEGVHIRNYVNGLIEFQEGYTPVDLGYQLPLKVTFFEYVGKKLSDIFIGSGNEAFKEYKDRFVVTNGEQLEYVLTKKPIGDSEKVFVQGIFKDSEDDYVVSENKITFKDDVLEIGKKIIITYTSGVEAEGKVLYNTQYCKITSQNESVLLEKSDVDAMSIIVILNGVVLNKFVGDYELANNAINLYDVVVGDDVVIYYSYTV